MDPVAEKSTFLCMYMSNHPDTLVAYTRYHGNVKEHVVSARMSSIDSKGMNLEYKVKGKEGEKKEVRVAFDPPLSGYEEVKPRLLGMTADAQESLGMTKSPQISDFELPSGTWKTSIPLALLVYTSVSPFYTGVQWEAGQWLYQTFGGYKVLTAIWAFAVTVHALEALYVQRLCSKHRTGFVVGLQYVLSTFFLGFTILIPMRKRIQKARIDSIMKGN